MRTPVLVRWWPPLSEEEGVLQYTSQPLNGDDLQLLLNWMDQTIGKPAWSGATLSCV